MFAWFAVILKCQKEFAQRLNISQSYLCRIEHGSRVITPEVESKIRDEFAADDLIISVLTVAAHVVKEGGIEKSDIQNLLSKVS
ncbi:MULTISPECIES: helix-turn-helix transcriptional regulator [Pelotomaculum]|uniref:helix-turn-helix domain-containing protein n=1 Tax=Pelotomaculum TaxID=191373 RepID=UPI00249E0289|nr:MULTISPECIES: helix-turn-helix transcriptional regulator [Pelotomaculum]